MPKILEPIRIKETKNFLENLEKNIKHKINKNDYKFYLESPVVYVHSWKTNKVGKDDRYAFYVGEAINIVRRTSEHYESGKNSNKWQKELIKSQKSKYLYLIANDHFNKSFTLDFENKMIQYGVANDKYIEKVINARCNPQGYYYPCEEFNDTFNAIYDKLNQIDKQLFLDRKEIECSAFYKSSPLHKLTDVQEYIQNDILTRVESYLARKPKEEKSTKPHKNELIMIEGEAGTGKSVLVSSTFFKILVDKNKEKFLDDVKCHLIVNNEEQVTVYKSIFKRLNIEEYDDIISRPATFINDHIKNNQVINPVDIVFVDEAHLLLTQKSREYQGFGISQLDDIRQISNLTIIMYDECQCLSTNQFLTSYQILQLREEARNNGDLLELKNQLRIQASDDTISWIKDLCDLNLKQPLVLDDKYQDKEKYELKLFDSIFEFEKAIKEKDKQYTLCRMIATYDWFYNENKKDCYVEIKENGKTWKKPWNYKIDTKKLKGKDLRNKDCAWAEKAYTINEIGSLYTIHGFDLNFAGVIIGPSIKFRNGKICVDKSASFNKRATNKRESKYDLSDILIKNELGILLKRGVNGLYLYICDEDLRNEVKKYIKIEK